MKYLNLVFEYLDQGGFVSYGLLILFLVITYVIGYRIAVLYRGRKVDVRKLYVNPETHMGSIQSIFLQEVHRAEKRNSGGIEGELEWLLMDTFQQIHRFSFLLNTAVLLAPLLGLLGTVIGMIETFASLANTDLFSSSGGIAGGISQALITTQFGLVVAIPGVFLSRYLKKLEYKTYLDTIQIQELFLQDKKVKS